MSLRLAILHRVFPKRMSLRILDELVRVTAEGFGIRTPHWVGGSFELRMAEYARFTAEQAGLLVDGGDEATIEAVREGLRQGAMGLGSTMRRRLGLRRAEEAFDAFRLIYRQLGIDVTAGPFDEITVARCFFADYYTEPVCQVVVALDQGLVTGLFNGASLEFSERLTGGRPCCRALLRPSETGR